MSDSYSAWCEEREAEVYDNEQKKIASFKKAKKWKNIVNSCKENLATTNFDVLEVCATCAKLCSAVYRFNHDKYCQTLGSKISYPEYQSCDKWTIDDKCSYARKEQAKFNEEIMLRQNV